MGDLITMLLTEHRGKCIGVLVALLLSVLFLTVGFWKTVLVAIVIGLGFFIGKCIDDVDFAERVIKLFHKS